MAAVAEIPGKGRALVASRPIQAGEVVLQEYPALLVVDEEYMASLCAACLQPARANSRPHIAGDPVFCSPACHANATQSAYWYPPHVCEAQRRLDRSGLSSEDASSLRFLVHAKAAKAAALHGQGPPEQLDAARRLWQLLGAFSSGGPRHPLAADLHRRLSAATGDSAGLTVEEVDELLRKEACNSYGIMAPSGPEGQRKVRGSGIYGMASLLNHDCLPNTARFDGFDAASSSQPGDTSLSFRALHDLPAGEELTASYFPLITPYQERQQRCQEVYGFECSCLRCQEEKGWEEEEDDSMDEEETAEAGGGKEGEGVDASYIQLFLLKYVCPREECFGTLAPVLASDQLQCNMCGVIRTEAEFMQELESM